MADVLRSERMADLSAPRKFSREEMAAWMAEDEADWRRIKAQQ